MPHGASFAAPLLNEPRAGSLAVVVAALRDLPPERRGSPGSLPPSRSATRARVKRELTALLFDLDGTLVDSTRLILRAYRHTMQRHLGVAPADDRWIAGLGKPLDAQLAEFARDETERAAMHRTYREFYLAHHDTLLRPFAGVPEALQALAARGTKLAVVTSKMRDTTERALAVCGFHRLFAAVVTVDDVRSGKPDPEPVRRALELLRAGPPEALFVGDSPFDMEAGRAAGVSIAAVTWGPFPRDLLARYEPDRWLARTAEIAELDR